MSSGSVTAERNIPWRRASAQGGQQQQQQQQQQQSNRATSGSGTPRDRSNAPPKAGNAQESAGRGQGQTAQKSGRRDNGAVAASGAKSGPTQTQVQPAPVAEGTSHVPVNGFNAEEIKSYMKKAYAQAVAVAGGDEKSLQVKLADSVQSKKNAPWGSRPNQMGNGQNFWLELTKQIKAQAVQGQKSSNASNEQARKGN